MADNPVIKMLGRRLRLAVIGGGLGSFIGEMHRTAARLDDRYEFVAAALAGPGAVSGRRRRSRPRRQTAPTGMPSRCSRPRRAAGRRRRRRDHDSQRQPSPICDGGPRPWLRRDLRQADNQHTRRGPRPREGVQTGLVFCLTHNYTGYPLVRQARAMVEDGQLGEIRLVQVEYVQGGKADENGP